MNTIKHNLHHITGFLVALSGLLALGHLHTRHEAYAHFSVISIELTRIASAGLGIFLLYFSLQIVRRKKRAWQIVTTATAILLATALLHPHHIEKIGVYAVALAFLVATRKIYTVKSENLSLRRGTYTALAIVLVAITYGSLGFYFLEKRDLGIDFTALESLKYALLQMSFQQQSLPLPNNEHAHIFLNSLNALSFTALALAVASLFKPVRFATQNNSSDRAIARHIITNHSASVEDYFKLWPQDKHYFFNTKKTAVLAYKVSGGTALVLDGPTGASRAYKKLLQDFTAFVEEQGWTPAIIHADESLGSIAQYKSVYIGSEAVVDVHIFAEKTHRSKHFRYVHNKAQRENLQVEIWKAPLSDTQLHSLRTISDQWIGTGGRREYTFVMGYFDNDYLRSCDTAVLLQEGSPIAYSNVIPSYIPSQRSIDHIRHTPTMPSIGMHFLLKELILSLVEGGVQKFNLGLSPLSGIDDRIEPNMPEKVLKIVKSVGARYYSFKGLEQFKNKFDPNWEPRFIYYRGIPTNLIKISNSLNRAVTVPRPSIGLRRKCIYIGSILAAVTYLSFPLGYILGSNNNGLVSQLAADGAPYNNVFNSLDIASGLLIMCVAALLTIKRPISTYQRNIAVLYALGGIGGLLAAIFTLPNSTAINITDPATITHSALSALNVAGILAAATCLTFITHTRSRLLTGLFFVYIALNITALIVDHTSYGIVVQRLQIAATSIWIGIIPYLIDKSSND